MSASGYNRTWRTVRVATPAAGADWELKAPGNASWRIVSITARLTASAAAANRLPVLVADDQTNTWWTQGASAAQTANQVIDHCAATGIGHAYATTGVHSYPLPEEGLLLRPGHRLRVATTALDAGDQWSLITAQVDEMPSDNAPRGQMLSVDSLE